MKSFALIALIIVATTLATIAQAQLPTVRWVSRIGGPNNDQTLGIARDSRGNSIVCGIYSNLARYGGTTFTSNGGFDVFISKISPRGRVRWTYVFGGAGTDIARNIAVDRFDNIYVGGSFSDTVTFAPGNVVTARTTTGSDAFVIKLTRTGAFVWVRTFGGTGNDQVTELEAVNNGVALVGFFSGGGVTLGPSTLNTAANTDAFIAKISFAGTFLWARQLGVTGQDAEFTGLAVDNRGNFYVSGDFNGTVVTPASFTIVSRLTDVLVAKISRRGRLIWFRRGGSDGDDIGNDVAVDNRGRVYSVGYVAGINVRFGRFTFTNANDSPTAFIVRLNSNTGRYTRRPKIATNNPYYSEGRGATVDALGNLYVVGTFNTTFAIAGSATQTGTGFQIFVAKLNANFALNWIYTAGGSNDEVGNNIIVNGRRITFTGITRSSDSVFGSRTIATRGSFDGLTVRLRQ